MYEVAQEIFDYLPINRSKPEADYIDHLWNAFVALDNTDNSARPFIMMPFHLLFMLVLQYKGIRIARIFPEATDLFFARVGGGRSKDKLLSPRRSVFDLALINERTLPELFRLVGFSEENTQITKSLIDNRNNNLAHAKGGIELDPDEKIDQYFDALRTLQPYLILHNDKIADQWLSEISEDDDLSEYVDAHLLDSQLCLADFRSGMLAVFSLDEDIPFEECQAVISKVIVSGSRPGLLWLQHIAQNHSDSARRFNMIQMLDEAGKLDEEFRALLLQNEKDSEILELLKNE